MLRFKNQKHKSRNKKYIPKYHIIVKKKDALTMCGRSSIRTYTVSSLKGVSLNSISHLCLTCRKSYLSRFKGGVKWSTIKTI